MTEPPPAPLPAPPLPPFVVQLSKPDLSPWRDGNVGIPGFMSFRGAGLGPHLLVMSLVHGNEIAGAIVLDALLRRGLRPLRGRLTFGFANLLAFDRFDPTQPTMSRFVDEDLNRIWDAAVLDGPRVSTELMRGRQMRRLVDQADVLLDLHSMLWPADPLILCGSTERGRALGREIGTPALVVADRGHAGGLRPIDYEPFRSRDSLRTACLVEAGQHWEEDTVAVTERALLSLLRLHGMIDEARDTPDAPEGEGRGADGRGDGPASAEVTETVTANTGGFAFVRPFRGGEVIACRDTLIATDGAVEIRTPYERCLLVMPNLRPTRGHTAVRLARFT